MAAKRPDFDQIKKLINQLEKLESDFAGIFGEEQAQREEQQGICRQVTRAQAVNALAFISVGELKNSRAGIRTAALEQAGFHTLLDLYRAPDYALQAVDGVGEKQVDSIRVILDEFLNRLAERERIRLTLEIPGGEGAGRPASVTGEGAGRSVSADEGQNGEHEDLVRRDAQAIREQVPDEIRRVTEAVEIRSRLGWFFSGRAKRERTVLAAAGLIIFFRGSLYHRAEAFVQMYREALSMPAAAALEDFEKNSAAFYALLEKLTGAQPRQQMMQHRRQMKQHLQQMGQPRRRMKQHLQQMGQPRRRMKQPRRRMKQIRRLSLTRMLQQIRQYLLSSSIFRTRLTKILL